MTNHDSTHTPTPEFRASLEQQVIDLYREESRAARPRRFLRFRTPMTLAAGLVLGMATQLAVGQVQRGKERSELEVAIDVKRMIAGSRLELARAVYEQSKKSFDVGATSRSALLAAEVELRAQEAAAYRLQLDLQEIRETASAPRDELWAPLVGGRDFVKDRLTAEASVAQQKQVSVEAAAAEVERSYRAGVVTKGTLDEAMMAVEQAKSDFELIAYKLMLRRKALEEHLTPQLLSQRVEQAELSRQIERVARRLSALQENYESARGRLGTGLADSLEVLRLQVKLMETNEELRGLRARMLRLPLKPTE
jgi:hypothetical protein